MALTRSFPSARKELVEEIEKVLNISVTPPLCVLGRLATLVRQIDPWYFDLVAEVHNLVGDVELGSFVVGEVVVEDWDAWVSGERREVWFKLHRVYLCSEDGSWFASWEYPISYYYCVGRCSVEKPDDDLKKIPNATPSAFIEFMLRKIGKELSPRYSLREPILLVTRIKLRKPKQCDSCVEYLVGGANKWSIMFTRLDANRFDVLLSREFHWS